MQTNFIVKTIIYDLFNRTFDSIIQIQAGRELPTFVLGQFKTSLEQLNRFSLVDKSLRSFNEEISPISDHNNLEIDNFSPGKCKNVFVIKQPKLILKTEESYQRIISTKSSHLNSYRDLNSSKQNTSRKQTKRDPKQSKSFINLSTQTSHQLMQVKQEQELRKQLASKREEQQLLKKKNSFSRITRQQDKKKATNKVKELKHFSFNYDSSIIRSKPDSQKLQSQTPIQQGSKPFHQISELRTNITKSRISDKSKKYMIVTSTPEILSGSIEFRQTTQKSTKNKSYRQQIVLNQHQNKSLLQIVKSSQNKIQKGIVVKQNIDGKLQFLRKDSIKSKSLFNLKKSQFDMSFGRKKFVHRYLRPVNNNSATLLN